MSVVVVATLLPLPQFRQEVVEIVERTVSDVQVEPGCERYALHESVDGLVMIETWADRDALAAHAQAPAVAAMRDRLEGKLGAPVSVQVLTPRPVGTPEQGVV